MNKEAFEAKIRFLGKQFSSESTKKQLVFDVVFGGIAPILCLFFDPIVFTGSKADFIDSYLAPYHVFFYLAISLGSIFYLVWLAYGHKLDSKWCSYFSAILFLGGIFAFILGVVMLPFSLIGLVIVIGVFGFIPFLTSFVYLRNGVRAFRQSKSSKTIFGNGHFRFDFNICNTSFCSVENFANSISGHGISFEWR